MTQRQPPMSQPNNPVQRFDPDISYGGTYSDAAYMEPSKHGEYVRFEDYQKLVENTMTRTDIRNAFAAWHLAISAKLNDVEDKSIREMAENYGASITDQQSLDLVGKWFDLDQIQKDLDSTAGSNA